MNWTETVFGAVPHCGDLPAVTEVRTGESLTHAAFSRRVMQAAAGLRRGGLRPGERVIVELPPGAGLLVAVHAAAWAGGVVALSRGEGAAAVLVTQADPDPGATGARLVVTMEPRPGATPFDELAGEQALEFGPIVGPAMVLRGEVLTHAALGEGLRRLAKGWAPQAEQTVVVAVPDRFRLLRACELTIMAGAHAVIAHEPSLVGCRVLVGEYRAAAAVVPAEVGRRLAAAFRGLRVVDEAVFGRRP
ncbi:AMP-binding protein [Thermoactinospora rubra]|uniref:AMP-binding protein n=1 Tax=Thermoactinospora rubra TaxID=1088767 RepID=UPI000A104B22|nr:AMP-binding protein [Thermoactinospora rubra]